MAVHRRSPNVLVAMCLSRILASACIAGMAFLPSPSLIPRAPTKIVLPRTIAAGGNVPFVRNQRQTVVKRIKRAKSYRSPRNVSSFALWRGISRWYAEVPKWRLVLSLAISSVFGYLIGKFVLQRMVRRAVMLIDREVLGVDVTIGRCRMRPTVSFSGLRPHTRTYIKLFDVQVKNKEGYEDENMLTVDEVEIDLHLIQFVWTWLWPSASKVFEISLIRLKNPSVLYEMKSLDKGLQHSNIAELIADIRAFVRRRIYTKDPKSEPLTAPPTPSTQAPCFQLRELSTQGLTAGISVDGIDLPIEHRQIEITDLEFSDFMGELRSNILQKVREARSDGKIEAGEMLSIVGGVGTFASKDSGGGGLISCPSVPMENIVAAIFEKLNSKVTEEVAGIALSAGASVFGSTSALATGVAESVKSVIDKDGDGSISPKEWESAANDAMQVAQSVAKSPQKLATGVAESVTSALDKDGDGSISPEELKSAANEAANEAQKLAASLWNQVARKTQQELGK